MPALMTRREESRIARRDIILSIARTIFLEKGFAATSMSEIAQRLGGSKATLWTYFPCKEFLFTAVIERETDTLNRVLEASFKADKTLALTLYDFATRFVAEMTSPDTIKFLRLVAADLERFPRLGTVLYEDGMRRTVKRLSDYLQNEMDAGKLRTADPEKAAEQFCALLKQPTHACIWFGARGTADVARFDIHAATDMFLRAYAA